jgi:hypothetical protein
VASVTGVRDPAVQPVRCPARPVSSLSGVQPLRCPVTRVRRPRVRRSTPVAVRPAVSSRLLSTPSVRTRPAPPPSAVALGLSRGGRQPSPRQPSRSCGGRNLERLGRRPSSPWGRATLPRSRIGQQGCRWRTRPGLGAGGGRACRLRGQAGQAGVRSACGWRRRGGQGSRRRRELAAPAGWLHPHAGWTTTVGDGQGGGPSGWPRAQGAGGDGVRPQRGPGWQQAFLAGRRQRYDLG